MENQFESALADWIQKEKSALSLINSVSTLYFDHSVELVLFRRKLIDKKISEVLNDVEFSKGFSQLPISIQLLENLAFSLTKLDMAPSKIDLGILAKEWLEEKESHSSVDAFVGVKLMDYIGQEKRILEPRDVVLYGFGRIGRLAARILSEQAGNGRQLRLKAIVVRKKGENDLIKRASLLRKDSVHGKMAGTVKVNKKNNTLIVNGNTVQVIYANNPDEIDYTTYGIHDALLIDNTGVWRDREGLSQHIRAKGISKVLLTAPGKGDVPNVVYGVNQHNIDIDSEKVFSASSCTTNAVVPVFKLMDSMFGIDSGHMETIHAYTNDQNLIDNIHNKFRRGRSAPLNMVLTETGAAKAAIKIFPHLKGKITASAVRVPVPNASLAIVALNLKKATTKEEVNELFRQSSLYGELVEQIGYSVSTEHVSSDVVGNTTACEVDAMNTIVSEDGKHVVIYAWYDNEYGYTCQVIRLAKYIANVRRLTYYSEHKSMASLEI